jgi:hypothetical protein
MPFQSNLPWFDHSNYTYLEKSTSYEVPYYATFPNLLPFRSSVFRSILLNILFSNTFRLRSSLNITDQVSHLCKPQAKL